MDGAGQSRPAPPPSSSATPLRTGPPRRHRARREDGGAEEPPPQREGGWRGGGVAAADPVELGAAELEAARYRLKEGGREREGGGGQRSSASPAHVQGGPAPDAALPHPHVAREGRRRQEGAAQRRLRGMKGRGREKSREWRRIERDQTRVSV
ncbi:hypothetical protein PVAP13_1NG136019 [Panicum virgatum]|uniref:Uncharacterized protein n=1 Tax=Panicum virgatum TaxID=38727 RepID=A0A8T0WJQ0_PANVG|nr:hypothetical protein PVAP13_1NG136019 [Panicum virgatum]